jgi:hypothetical protein
LPSIASRRSRSSLKPGTCSHNAQSYNINTDIHASDSHIIQKSALLLRCLPDDPLGNGGVLLTQLIYHTFDMRITENPKIVSNDLRFVLKYRVSSLLPSPS